MTEVRYCGAVIHSAALLQYFQSLFEHLLFPSHADCDVFSNISCPQECSFILGDLLATARTSVFLEIRSNDCEAAFDFREVFGVFFETHYINKSVTLHSCNSVYWWKQEPSLPVYVKELGEHLVTYPFCFYIAYINTRISVMAQFYCLFRWIWWE